MYVIIKNPYIFHKHDEYLLVHAITCRKSRYVYMYLSEIRKKLNEVTGVITTESTLHIHEWTASKFELCTYR